MGDFSPKEGDLVVSRETICVSIYALECAGLTVVVTSDRCGSMQLLHSANEIFLSPFASQ